jgi:hypothetical protein
VREKEQLYSDASKDLGVAFKASASKAWESNRGGRGEEMEPDANFEFARLRNGETPERW